MSNPIPKSYQWSAKIIETLIAAGLPCFAEPYDKSEQTSKIKAAMAKNNQVSIAVTPMPGTTVFTEVGGARINRWQTNICIVIFATPNLKKEPANYRIEQMVEQVANHIQTWGTSLSMVAIDQPLLASIADVDTTHLTDIPNVVARGLVYSMMNNF